MPDQPIDLAAQDQQNSDNMRGMGWMVLSVLGAAAMIIAVRFATAEISSSMVVFLRAAIPLAVLLPALALVPAIRSQLRFSRPWLHVARGCLIGASTQFGFYAVSVIPLATASVLFMTAPIFATVFNIYLHKEKVGPRRMAAASIGFIGAIVVLRPDVGTIDFGMFAAMMSSVLFGLTLSLSRNVAKDDGAFSAYVSSVVLTAIVATPLAAQDFRLPDMSVTWFAVFAVVVASFLRNIGDIQAYRWAEASALITLTYTRLVIVAVLAYFFFAEVPDTATIVGAAIIIGSTLYIAQRQAVLKRKLSEKSI